MIAEKSEDSDEDQPFCIDDMLIGMILDTEQADEVKVVRPPNGSSWFLRSGPNDEVSSSQVRATLRDQKLKWPKNFV